SLAGPGCLPREAGAQLPPAGITLLLPLLCSCSGDRCVPRGRPAGRPERAYHQRERIIRTHHDARHLVGEGAVRALPLLGLLRLGQRLLGCAVGARCATTTSSFAAMPSAVRSTTFSPLAAGLGRFLGWWRARDGWVPWHTSRRRPTHPPGARG